MPQNDKDVRPARIASIVIFVTIILWMALQWLGGQMGLEARYAFLFDFAALGAFAWALFVLFNVWRRRQ